MITFTTEEQALLDRGWPRMIRLVDGHPHHKNPEKAALAWGSTWRGDVHHSEWPREAAAIAVRVGPRISPRGKRRKLHAGEPAELLSRQIGVLSGSSTYEHAREWVFLVEAHVGADATLTAIADGFESMRGEPRDHFGLHFAVGAASSVGFMLLRANDAKKHAARLEAFRSKLAGRKPMWETLAGYLDASLDGRAGLDRWLGPSRRNVIAAEYAHDDASYVRACVDESEPSMPFSVRLVAIAGPAVMKNITRRKFYAGDLRAVVRDFGMIRSPETVDLMLSLVGRTTAKDAPASWFASHADFAMPIVESYASRGSERAKAIISAVRKAATRPSS
jgi:hypothetical protein